MDRRMIAVFAVLAAGMLLAGCTGNNNPNPKKVVTASQKNTVETSYDVTAALADTVEALDAMIGNTGFANGTAGSVTVDGHGTNTVSASWTGTSTGGNVTVTTKAGTTTVSTYTVTYTGAITPYTVSYVTHVAGKTSRGAELNLNISISKTGTNSAAAVQGTVAYGGTTYDVAGGSNTDSVTKSAQWAYVITDPRTEITTTIVASYTAGTFSGVMTITTKRGVDIATATTTGNGSVTVKYADGSNKTIEVFPDPTQ